MMNNEMEILQSKKRRKATCYSRLLKKESGACH
jgi:hypothetical protein